jgi:hypothetical protein
LSKQLLENGINSHDDLIEQLIFTSSTAGGDEFNGLDSLVSTAGTGVVGGIDCLSRDVVEELRRHIQRRFGH